jgi:hypothetical protein
MPYPQFFHHGGRFGVTGSGKTHETISNGKAYRQI